MNTKRLMTASSIFLAGAGLVALFAPQEVLAFFGLPQTSPMPIFIELLGALYLGFGLTNWTAKDSLIGGVYARPTSLGNFAHFMIGALTLARPSFAGGLNVTLLVVLAVYVLFAVFFAWLAFVSAGANAGPLTSTPKE